MLEVAKKEGAPRFKAMRKGGPFFQKEEDKSGLLVGGKKIMSLIPRGG